MHFNTSLKFKLRVHSLISSGLPLKPLEVIEAVHFYIQRIHILGARTPDCFSPKKVTRYFAKKKRTRSFRELVLSWNASQLPTVLLYFVRMVMRHVPLTCERTEKNEETMVSTLLWTLTMSGRLQFPAFAIPEFRLSVLIFSIDGFAPHKAPASFENSLVGK